MYFSPFLLIGRGREWEKIYTLAIHSFPYICHTRHHNLNTMGTPWTPLSSEVQGPALKYRIWREQLSLFLLLANNFQSCSPKPLNHFKWTFQNKKKKIKTKPKLKRTGFCTVGISWRSQLQPISPWKHRLQKEAYVCNRKALALLVVLTAPPVTYMP